MTLFLRACAVCAFLALVLPSVVEGRQGPDQPGVPVSESRLRFGPLGLRPRIAVSNVGVDTNVFNTATGPSRDFTATLLPALDSRLRIGRTVASATTTAELIYFQKSTTQRSAALSQSARYDMPLTRIAPFVLAARSSTRQRPNLEIDERVERVSKEAGAGISLLPTGRVTITGSFNVLKSQYGTPPGASSNAIADALDHTTSSKAVQTGIELTPLTTFTIQVLRVNDRFATATFRNNDATEATVGFRFKPFALISGSGAIGYRVVAPKAADVPRFSGVVGKAELTYVWRDTTRILLNAERALDYSVATDDPYFITLTGGVVVTQSLGGRWDARVQLARSSLGYRHLISAVGSTVGAARVDRMLTYGAGLGFRMNPDTRVGVDLVYNQRRSALSERQYNGFRCGGSLSYVY